MYCLKGTRGSNLAGPSGSSGNCLARVRPETPRSMDSIPDLS